MLHGAFADVPRVPPKFPVRAVPLAAVQAEAWEAAAYFQSKRALPDFSISVRWWLLHTALVLQWLLTLQSLIHSFVQLIIGKTGELLSFIQAIHFAIFTLSELGQFSLNSFPKTEIRAFGTRGVGGAFSSTRVCVVAFGEKDLFLLIEFSKLWNPTREPHTFLTEAAQLINALLWGV